jgi:predicted ATPase
MVSAKPCLKIVGLHVEGLKALRNVDWPADGMAWGKETPNLVMVGGVNGSGKTTVLELIADAVRMLRGDGPVMWQHLPAGNAWVDMRLVSERTGEEPYRIVIGDGSFVRANVTDACTHFTRTAAAGWSVSYDGDLYTSIHDVINDPRLFDGSDLPRLVYFPTDRQLVIPDEQYKAAGRLNGSGGFVHRFQPAAKWSESIEAVLYSARWADLNAKEQGRPGDATHFESYSNAFEGFFGATKKLVWTPDGELVVQVADGVASHPINELSSGEKQVLLFCAELYRRWKPGSLILIDEPELHFHPSWQTTLWTLLERWQKERGGQVIVATQSSHLFGIAEPGTTVLLGKPLA